MARHRMCFSFFFAVGIYSNSHLNRAPKSTFQLLLQFYIGCYKDPKDVIEVMGVSDL